MSKRMTGGVRQLSIAAALGAVALAVLPVQWNPAAAQANWKAEWDKLIAAGGPWKADWDRTVAAAKKEGTVVLLIPPSRTGRAFLQKAWPQVFPEIKLSLTTMRSTQFVQKVKTERGAGKYLWDAALTGTSVGFQLRNVNALDPVRGEFIFPDVKDPKTWGGWDQAFFDNTQKYVFTIRSMLKMPFYNAKMLPPAKVKALGSKVFLDPSLKGKVVWHNPLIGGSGRTFSLVMHRLLGDEGMRKFLTEQVVIVRSMNDAVDGMARQKYAMSLGPIMTGLMKRYEKAGIKLDIRPTGNTPEMAAYGNTGGSSLIILKNRPNPNALRVWVNWLLSKPVAYAMSAAMEEDSRRTDVPSVVEPERQRVAGKTYIEPQREDLEPKNKQSQNFIRKVIKK